jgi:hypothetical protein
MHSLQQITESCILHIVTSITLLQLNPAASVSSQKTVRNEDEVKCRDDVEVYQQVKYFRRSVHEVNQLLGAESVCDVTNPVDKTHKSAGGTCDSDVTQTTETGAADEFVQIEDCVVPQKCSVPFVEEFSEKLPTGNCEEMEHGHTGQHEDCAECVMESESGADCESELESCGIVTGSGSHDTECHSIETHQEGSKFCDSVIERCVPVQIKASERQTSSDRNEYDDSPLCASSEPSQLSPEHRRWTNLDSNPNRRRFESEIGRDILRERRMRQELEEVRIANQG